MDRREEELTAKLRAIWAAGKRESIIPKSFKITLLISNMSTAVFIACLFIVYQYAQRHVQQPPAPVKAIASPAPVKPVQVKPAPVKVKPVHKPHKHKAMPVIVTAKILPVEDTPAYEGHLDEDIFELEVPLPPANLEIERWTQVEEEPGDA